MAQPAQFPDTGAVAVGPWAARPAGQRVARRTALGECLYGRRAGGCQVVATGLEESHDSSGNDALSTVSGAESGADFKDSGDFEPRLARLVKVLFEVWPGLSESTRDSLEATVDEAARAGD
jgi:hypothetical protein